MSHTYSGGCKHIHTYADAQYLDSHDCHCSICRGITGGDSLHVTFFKYADLKVDHPDMLQRQPYNVNNPNGPLELCTCSSCGQPIMVDDKQHRIRIVAPALMGYDENRMKSAYHAFFDPAAGNPRPGDGRPVYEGLRPDFVMPDPT